jgi:hypothetical protein
MRENLRIFLGLYLRGRGKEIDIQKGLWYSRDTPTRGVKN